MESKKGFLVGIKEGKKIYHTDGNLGGYLEGNRHSEGGIKGENTSTGQPLEVEGGEVQIVPKAVTSTEQYSFEGKKMTPKQILSEINQSGGGVPIAKKGGSVEQVTEGDHKLKLPAHSVIITRNAVSDDTKREFEGEMLTNREILSRINQSGGGVAFADGGSVPHKCSCSGKTYKYGGKTMTDFEIVEDLNMSDDDRLRKQLADKYAAIEDKHYKAGGALDSLNLMAEFTDCARFFLASLWETGASFMDYSAKKRGDLKELEDLNLIYVTRSSSPDCIEAHLTDKGKRFISTVSPTALYKKGGVLECGCGCGKLKKGGKVDANKTYFKGVKHTYKNQFEINKAIEELLASKSAEEFTVDEMQFLTYFAGYGGMEKYGATGKGLKYEYYTPSLIARKMWGLAYKHGFKGGLVMEPSCGIGEFIKYAPDPEYVVGYETNPVSAKIAQLLYPKAKIYNDNFETLFIKNRKTIGKNTKGMDKYSLVIGNPPYGGLTGFYAGMGEDAYTKATNFIDYFIFRGLDLLESGGLLIYIVGAEVAIGGKPFLAGGMTKTKQMIADKADLIDAYRLPNGVFEFTDVLSDIVVFKKK